MNLSEIANLSPEIAKNIKIEVSGADLLHFAQTLSRTTAKEVEEKIKARQQPDELLTRQQVADKLNITLVTLWHWNKKGILPIIKVGNQVRYRKSQLDQLLKTKTTN